MAITSKSIFPTKEFLSSFFAYIVKEHDLHLGVMIESNKIFFNTFAETGEDFIFRIRSNTNEEELEKNSGLPFRLRAKVILKAIVDNFPRISDEIEWEVPVMDPSDSNSAFNYKFRPKSDYELNIENIEAQIKVFDAIDFLYGKFPPTYGKIPPPLTSALKFRLIGVSKF
jgi:hypothetical protein